MYGVHLSVQSGGFSATLMHKSILKLAQFNNQQGLTRRQAGGIESQNLFA